MPITPLPLRDIHTPELISWWPPAIGWWLLAITTTLTLYLLFRLYKRLTRNNAVKTAKKILQQIKQNTANDSRKKLSELSILIRRVAISTEPREKTASLIGNTWLTFLDASVKGSPFTEGIGRYLAETPYQKALPDELEISQLISLCEEWLNAQNKKP